MSRVNASCVSYGKAVFIANLMLRSRLVRRAHRILTVIIDISLQSTFGFLHLALVDPKHRVAGHTDKEDEIQMRLPWMVAGFSLTRGTSGHTVKK
ncbi:hypothetical protein DESC_730084 [Desulfosarcina cetonica]|nr:hypothetical protein DESC_730084 [Desulfosarcina cetonica]